MQQTPTESITTNRMPRRLALDNTVYHETKKNEKVCRHQIVYPVKKTIASEFDKIHFQRSVRERKRGVSRRNNLIGDGSKGFEDEKGEVRSIDESCSMNNSALGPKKQLAREMEGHMKKFLTPSYADITDQWFYELE